ncbi:MAG: hypothetical protein AABZ74_15650, partial [Cyanobacteriota bacterium]
NVIKEFFEQAIDFYSRVISNSEKGELLDKALKEAVYFHAYAHCKIKEFDKALFFINTINILEQNWITFFLKTGYFVMRYESENKEEFLDFALQELNIAYQYENEKVKEFITYEKDKELKVLWELRNVDMLNLLEGNLSE